MAPLAIIAEQANADCIKSITQDQANQPAGTGYTVLLANPLNNTQVRFCLKLSLFVVLINTKF